MSPLAYSIRYATAAEAPALYTLIEAHRVEGHLLPRTSKELETHADRFIVIESMGRIIACAELMKLSPQVAEVRSLVVDREHRRGGVAAELMSSLVDAARDAGYLSLCAFTHSPAFFVKQGFSIVPHTWLPEKIQANCTSCAFFRRCEQYAMLLPLDLMAGALRSAQTAKPAARFSKTAA